MCLCVLCLVAWQPGLGRKRAGEEGGLLAGMGCGDSFLRTVAPGTRLPGTRGFRLGTAGQASSLEPSPEQQELMVGTPGTESQTTAGVLVLPAV